MCLCRELIGFLSEVSLVGDDALRELADVDEEQREGEDPSQVVAGEMKPRVVVDLDLGALAAPTWYTQTDTERVKELSLFLINSHQIFVVFA